MSDKREALIARLKAELDQLRQQYPPTERIRCQLCGKKFKAVGFLHLWYKHGVTPDDYKREFDRHFIYSDQARLINAKKHIVGKAEIIWLRRHAGSRLLSRTELFKLIGVSKAPFERWMKEFSIPCPRYIWTKEIIVGCLRERAKQGLPMNSYAICQDDIRLWGAAYRYFGSLEKALQAAGFYYKAICKQTWWSRPLILQRLRQLAREGKPINSWALRTDSKLLGACIRHFGSYRKAIQSAGFNYEDTCKAIPWSRALIIRRLRERRRKGLPLNYQALFLEQPKFHNACSRYFGTYAHAIRAAGFDYKTIRQDIYWNRPLLIHRLRERARQGLTLKYHALQSEQSSLTSACVRYFGTYGQAVRAAGLNYDKICLRKIKTT